MARPSKSRAILALLAAAAVAAQLSFDTAVSPARAQGWWPWASPSQPPPPRPPAPPRDPQWRTQPGPGGPVGPGPAPGPGVQPGPFAAPGGKPPICLQLEQRLVMEGQRGTVSREQLPRIENELRQADRAAQAAQAMLERSDCYDYFLFSKTLRRTRQCVDLAAQAEGAKRKVTELDIQRQQILGTRDRSHLDDVYRELARNNCGPEYAREVQRRGLNNPFSSLWQDEDAGPGRGNEFGALPFATYRTVCVRLCDGYFFPVSFSTLKNHFDRDIDACQSKCAAPAELYYYQNPGGTIEQAISVRNQSPYTSLKSAFRYRKELVSGCSCKQAEYVPSPADRGDRKADAAPLPPAAGKQAAR